MDQITITMIDEDDRASCVTAYHDASRVLLATDALAGATGWTLKSEGLCRGDVCVPTRTWPELTPEPTPADGTPLIDLAVFGALVHQPIVIDANEGLVVLGTSASVRTEQLFSLDAPDFTLNNLDGEAVELADFRGRKKLLVAFASW